MDRNVPTEEELVRAAESLNIKYDSLNAVEIERSLLDFFPVSFVSHYHVMPLSLIGSTLTVAVSDPENISAVDDISSFLKIHVVPVLSSHQAIQDAVHKYYGLGAGTVHRLFEDGLDTEVEQIEEDDSQEDTSIVALVNTIINEAIKNDATDVHLEPFSGGLRARFRIDGVLSDVSLPDEISRFYPSIVSRIKILSQLDIAEKRLPQDGRIQMRINDVSLDLRVSTMPLVSGEGVHLRVLRQNRFLDFASLGIDHGNLSLLEDVIHRPNGMILVTGPTGSGKSTTLYACLDRINSQAVKVITVEDPVEYNLKGINQIQIHPSIGLTFAQGLRHILRHDPDVLMVGEIRDSETAEIAMRAALTGHLVFSTLHTNDAPGAVTRLLDMDFEPFLISSSLECVVAQRLVRRLCQRCRKEAAFELSVMKMEIGVADPGSLKKVYEPVGCPDCRMTGYKGRTGIYEIMMITDQIRDLILKRAPSSVIREAAERQGMRTLVYDGIEKVRSGVTSIAELLRVIKDE